MTLSKFAQFFPAVLLLIVLTACQDDEVQMTGELQVTFTNVSEGLSVNIAPAENPDLSISGSLSPASNGVLQPQELNPGNYLLWSSAQSVTYETVGFQIRAGKTTTIHFDEMNAPHIQTK